MLWCTHKHNTHPHALAFGSSWLPLLLFSLHCARSPPTHHVMTLNCGDGASRCAFLIEHLALFYVNYVLLF